MKKRSPLHIVDKLHMYKSHLELIYLIYNRMNRTFTTQKQLTLLLLFKFIFQAVQTVNSTVVVAVQDPGLISQGITSWARRASSSPYILFHWIKSLVIAVLAENFLFFVPSGPNIKKKKKNRNEFSLDSYIKKQKMDPKLVGDIPKITILLFSACLNR